MILVKTITAWLDDRTGIFHLWDRLTAGYTERHAAWLRTTGMACLVLVLVEIATGCALGLYYSAGPSTAYKSVVEIEANPMGHFLRGIHHWASAALILLSFFTVARMFFLGEYKDGEGRRRDIVWIGAIIFSQLALAFQLSGHVLPWDTNGVKTADVEAGIASNIWVIGTVIKRFLIGGGSTGSATLARSYAYHVLLLPLFLAALVGIPLCLARMRGDSNASLAEPKPSREPYYPFHMAREMVTATAVFLIIVGLTLAVKTPLEKEATQANLENYTAMSEWYVLPLHALTLIPPFNKASIEPIATAVLPGALITVLIFLPFLDRNPERSPRKRPVATALGVIVIGSVLGLYGYALAVEKKPELAETPQAAAATNPDVENGKKLYASNGCDACHTIAGKGGKAAPDLSHAGAAHGDIDWQVEHLKKPTSKSPTSTMPAYDSLKPEELKALATYMTSLK